MTEDDRWTPPQILTQAQQRRARWIRLAGVGLAGAVTVTLLNEGVRRRLPHAPRIEVIGERALAGSLEALNVNPPQGEALYRWTLLGDLISNTVYYSLVGLGTQQHVWQRGSLLGLAAGVGAVVLPRPLGLGRQPGERPMTLLLTAGWYLAGGLGAAATAQRWTDQTE